MSTAEALDDQITQGLSYLNIRQKKTILTVVKSLMDDQKDWWDEIGEEQRVAIDVALAEVKAGKLTSHEEVMKKYRK